MRITGMTIVALLVCCAVKGQDFTSQAALPRVDQDGFYKIALDPDLSCCFNTAFSNLRIVGRAGAQVPYVTGEEVNVAPSTEFIAYPIEEKFILPDSATIIVLRNDAVTSINNFSLVIRNAAVRKEVALFGSDDKETWYALKDRFTLGNIENDRGTAEIKIIGFPSSDYAYYKLWINDKDSAPLNILRVGYYTDIAREIKYEELGATRISQEHDAENGKSYVTISVDTTRTFERMEWEVAGPPFYHRSASLYAVRVRKDKKGRKQTYRDYLAGLQLNSRHENILYLPPTRTDNLLLEIENGDNPPLTVSQVKLYQVSRHIIAWLEKDVDYALMFGSEAMIAPQYDLELFKDSIPATLVTLTPAPIRPINRAAEPERPTFFTTTMFVWVAIAVVAVVLGIMSVKMIRETRQAQK